MEAENWYPNSRYDIKIRGWVQNVLFYYGKQFFKLLTAKIYVKKT